MKLQSLDLSDAIEPCLALSCLFLRLFQILIATKDYLLRA